MTRFLLNFVLPFLAPMLLFIAWAWLFRGPAGGTLRERLRQGPWFWLILSGLILGIAGLIFLGVTGGGEAGSEVIAPRFEGGRVVPAEIR